MSAEHAYVVRTLKPGRESFHLRLKGICDGIVAKFYREQLTHTQYLKLRQERLFDSEAWKRAKSGARERALAYLEGATNAVYLNGMVVWRHRWEGAWVDKGDPRIDYSKLDASQSRHVWASSNKVFFGGEP